MAKLSEKVWKESEHIYQDTISHLLDNTLTQIFLVSTTLESNSRIILGSVGRKPFVDSFLLICLN